MKDRLVLCLLGAWLMGSVMMFAVAPQNFHVIDHLLLSSTHERFRALTTELGAGTTRELLRYLASELNRAFFLQWNLVQLLLGAPAVLILWRRSTDPRARRWAFVALLDVVLLLGFTPMIVLVGRSLDFVPRDPAPPQLVSFQALHIAYTLIDVIKVVCLGVATLLVLRAEPARA